MRIAVFALLALLAACASQPPAPVTVPSAPPTTSAPPGEDPARPAAPPSQNVAVASLVQNARNDAAAGRLANAEATLERALRIEPRNPRLLQELARLRLRQGQYAQAEQVALKANSLSGGDNGLRAENWRLIAQAREARGDPQGARAAMETADKIGRQ